MNKVARILTVTALFALVIWLLAVWSYELPIYREGAVQTPDMYGNFHARGSIHIHSAYSHDSTTPISEIMLAAKNNDLDFAIVTDHNNRDARVDEGFRDGVLLMAGMEASSEYGHFLVLDAASELTERQRRGADFGEVKRLGGFSIVAHPIGGRNTWGALGKGGYDGIEIINMKTMLEVATELPSWRLAASALVYPFNPRYSLLMVYQRPFKSMEFIDSEILNRPFVITCGADAHGFPPHRYVMAGCVNHLLLSEALIGEFKHDSELIYRSIKEGQVFAAMDIAARADSFSWKCENAPEGRRLRMTLTGFKAAKDAKSVVTWGGKVVVGCSSMGQECVVPVPLKGPVRIEIRLDIPTPLGYKTELSWIQALACYDQPPIQN